jgi:hypothetical protein
MIDAITLTKKGLSESEIFGIVENNHLQTNTKAGETYYDNMSTKNLDQQKGVFIRIETNNKLKIECSLHKYFNEINGNRRTNYNLFSMIEAKSAISNLLSEKKINSENLRVYNYEIGLNMNVSNNCRAYLDKMTSIGATGEEKKLYINPRYRDERIKTTVFHNTTKKYFKVYDKNFEAKDKKRNDVPDFPILRIETVIRRVENHTINTFFNPEYLGKLVEQFFRDWKTLQFIRDIEVRKGTGTLKQELCKRLIILGKEAVLKEEKERYKTMTITAKQYRNKREFITREWDNFKTQIKLVASPEETEYKALLQIYYNLLKY